MNLRDLRLRLRALFARHRAERDLGDELEFHLEMEARKLAATGMSAETARAQARARFGSATVAAEECRDARGTTFVESCVRDVVYALRSFRRAPTVALTIAGTLALGLGLVAAVFTVFNHFVFRSAAVHDPSALFGVDGWTVAGPNRIRFTRPQYEALRRETDVFSGVLAAYGVSSRIDGRIIEGNLVTGNYFDVLGVRALRGRALAENDDVPGGEPVLVLSHIGWARLFASDPDVIGRTMPIHGIPHTVVGVMPEGFTGLGPFAPDYWAPLARLGQFRPGFAGREDVVGLDVVGRLKPGIRPETAQAVLNVRAAGAVIPDAQRTAGVRLESRRTPIRFSPLIVLAFSPLYVAFGLVLLIGCANVANLLLARAVLRQREIAIRLSIGASRRRVMRQLLTESLLLGLAASAGALLVSRGVLHLMIAALVGTMPPELAEYAGALHTSSIATDWRVVAFLVAAAVFSTAVFGLVPALHATRINLVRAVRGEVIGGGPGRARNLLIVVQVTASVLLLACAAMFLRSTLRASAADPGLRTDDTIVVAIANEPFRAAMVHAVMTDPAVAVVAAMWRDPMGQPRAAFASPVPADVTTAGEQRAFRSPERYRFVSPEYFRATDVPVLRGRTFTEAEATAASAVAMVSESTAQRLWPGADAVGRMLRLEPDPDSETRAADEPALPAPVLTVVGVVRDIAGFSVGGFGVAGDLNTDIYVPTTPAAAATSLLLRVDGDPDRVRHALLERLAAIDPNMGDIMTLRTVARLETYPLQLGFWLTVVLGGLALVLTVSGLFSVLSYLVEQRTKEIGVRMALGATAAHVMGLVLSQSMRVVTAGLIAGTGLAWAVGTLLLSMPAVAHIGAIVDVRDPLAYGVSLLCIIAACALAAAVPARRAARVDPIAALRED